MNEGVFMLFIWPATLCSLCERTDIDIALTEAGGNRVYMYLMVSMITVQYPA